VTGSTVSDCLGSMNRREGDRLITQYKSDSAPSKLLIPKKPVKTMCLFKVRQVMFFVSAVTWCALHIFNELAWDAYRVCH